MRFGIASYCLGTAWTALVYESPAFDLLFEGWRWSDADATDLTSTVAIVLLVLIPLLFWPRATPLCGLVSLWVGMELWARWFQANRDYELAPLSMAVRYTAPVALLFAWRGRLNAAMWLLRFACAATFAGHGVAALREHPQFVDYILGAAARVGWDFPQEAAIDVLFVIGIIDFVVAAFVVAWPLAPVLIYMVAWGFITALARVVHGGWGNHPEFFVRVTHSMAPLAVFLHLRYRQRRETCP